MLCVLKVYVVQQTAGQIQGKDVKQEVLSTGRSYLALKVPEQQTNGSYKSTPGGHYMLVCLLLNLHYWPFHITKQGFGLTQGGHSYSEHGGSPQLLLSKLKLALIYSFTSCPHFSAIQRQESFYQVLPDYL